MRKCPTAHQMFGRRTIWDLNTHEFSWIIEGISEEYSEITKQNKKQGK